MMPAMCVVRIQNQYIICTSSGGYSSQGLQMRSGSGNQIQSEDDVW